MIFELTNLELGLIIGACVLVIIVIVLAAILLKKKSDAESKEPKIIVKDGVRYNAKSDNVSTIKYNVGDTLLSQGITYVVEKDGDVIPGKYYMMPAQENMFKFNVRIGGFVREYSREDEIVLNEGDEITATSCNIVLK